MEPTMLLDACRQTVMVMVVCWWYAGDCVANRSCWIYNCVDVVLRCRYRTQVGGRNLELSLGEKVYCIEGCLHKSNSALHTVIFGSRI